MKRAIRLVLAVILSLAMAVPCFAAAKKEFYFESGKTVITVGDEADKVIRSLGDTEKIFEHRNGSTQVKVYSYPDFELSIVPDGICSRISDIYLPADSEASTPEGLHIGSSKEEMIELYGKNYEESRGVCKYTKGESFLLVYLSGDKVDAIEYQLAAEFQ